MKNRLIIIGADFSANALVGQIETEYQLLTDIASVDVPRGTIEISIESYMATYNDDVFVGSTPADITATADGGLTCTVGEPTGNIYPITIDGSAATSEECTITVTQPASNKVITIPATATAYAIKASVNAPVMAVCYAKGWAASPDYMTFEEAAAVTTFDNAFAELSDVSYFPEVKYFTSVRDYKGAFKSSAFVELDLRQSFTSLAEVVRYCAQLKRLKISGSISGDMTSSVRNTPLLEYIDFGELDNSLSTGVGNMFEGTTAVKEVVLSPNGFYVPAYPSLLTYDSLENCVKITGGYFDFSTTKSYDYIFGSGRNKPLLRRLEARNLGMLQNGTSINAQRLTVWGINSDEVPDAEESFKNTMRYLFDRASAGYSTCTITLSANTKAILNTDATLLAEVVAKGYTIA